MRFRDLPINRKFMVSVAATSAAALVAASIVFIVAELEILNRQMKRDLLTLADMVGINSTAALTFADPEDAAEVLSSLRSKPTVLTAHLLTPDGRPLASYYRDDVADRSGELVSGPIGEPFTAEDMLLLHFPITLDNEQVGMLYIESSLQERNGVLMLNVLVVLLALLIAASGALFLAAKLGHIIARPIDLLTETARSITRDQNYGTRAAVLSGDEVGILASAFNDMLSQLQRSDAELRTAKQRAELSAIEAERLADETKVMNKELQYEVSVREQAEKALERAHAELEKRVEQRTAELVRSNKDLEQFAYVASHDLQEPLRSVASYTQLLAKRYKGKLDADADEFITYAVEGANRMQLLINDLLAYSRVGTQGKPFEAVDCEKLLSAVLADLDAAVRENEATVTHNPLPVVEADATQLKQVFQNLIANSLKFRGDEPPRVHLSAEETEEEHIFSVQDNGIGLDEQYQDRVFVVFQRLHTRKRYQGSGIGLSFCKRVVLRHGGKIWYESKEGHGAKFVFTLPKRRR